MPGGRCGSIDKAIRAPDQQGQSGNSPGSGMASADRLTAAALSFLISKFAFRCNAPGAYERASPSGIWSRVKTRLIQTPPDIAGFSPANTIAGHITTDRLGAAL